MKAELIWVVGYLPKWFTCPKTVNHPGTDRARRRATVLIGDYVLTANRELKATCAICWEVFQARRVGGVFFAPADDMPTHIHHVLRN